MKTLKILASMLIMTIPASSMAYYDSAVEAANLLAEHGYINDQSADPSKYNLDFNIQRQEIMKVAMNMAGEQVWASCEGKFSDVDKSGWACPYIEKALERGIISHNEKFRPNDLVTKSEAIKIIMESMRAAPVVGFDNWQKNYMLWAYNYGIIEDKFYDYNTNANRAWIFEIAAKAVVIEEEKEEEEMKEKLGKYSDEAE